MKKVYKRRKAFVGAIIGAVGSIAGGIIGAKQKRKALRAQREKEAMDLLNQNRQIQTNAYNASLGSDDNEQQDFLDKYSMRYGGKVSKKYNDRNKKGFGGIGEIIGGVLGAAGTVAEAATGIQGLGAAGGALGGLANSGINGFSKNQIEKKRAKTNQELTATQQAISPTQAIGNYRDRLPNKLPMMPTYRCGGTIKRR